MGEISDDMVSGRSCSTCGTYFKAEHGYPVQCAECNRDQPDDSLQEATIEEA